MAKNRIVERNYPEKSKVLLLPSIYSQNLTYFDFVLGWRCSLLCWTDCSGTLYDAAC